MAKELNELETMAVRILQRRSKQILMYNPDFGNIPVADLVESTFDGGLDYSITREICRFAGKDDKSLLDDYVDNQLKFKKDSREMMGKFLQENRSVVDKTIAEIAGSDKYPYCCLYTAVRKDDPYAKDNVKDLTEQLVTYTAAKVMVKELDKAGVLKKGKYINISDKKAMKVFYDTVNGLAEKAERNVSLKKPIGNIVKINGMEK